MSASAPKPLSIRVVSDVICPWCFIGKRRLEKALADLGDTVRTEIFWSPFELNPGMPEEGIDRKTYRTTKFGSWSKSLELDAEVSAAGRGEGIHFDFPGIRRTPNTFAAHRLIWVAQRQGRQDAVVESLFRAYFTEGRDIGDLEELAAIAARCGIDPVVASDFLASDEGRVEVAADAQRAREQGISGVPTFIVNEAWAIPGAAESGALASVLLRASKTAVLA